MLDPGKRVHRPVQMMSLVLVYATPTELGMDSWMAT